jgi:hypothetical protein
MTADTPVSTGGDLVAEACRIFDGPVVSVTPDETEQRLGMRHFLGWWFAKCDPNHYVDLRAFTSRRGDAPWTERIRLGALDAAVDRVMEWNRTRCTYTGTCPRKSADSEARTGAGVACVPGFWADVDQDTPEIVPRLRGFTKPPDHIVFSGHGYHAYWRFDQPVEPTATLKRQLKILARVLDGDPAVAEFARVMRVPFSWNRKKLPHVQARIVP